jgi:uncharacterized membrane protein YccC
MPDIRNDFSKTAQDFTKAVEDAAYVAIGLGVLGYQKVQVRRQELLALLNSQRSTFDAPLTDVRKEFAKALKEFDRNLSQVIERVDATFEPVEQRLPATAQAVVQQAKEARDQLRTYLTQLAA